MECPDKERHLPVTQSDQRSELSIQSWLDLVKRDPHVSRNPGCPIVGEQYLAIGRSELKPFQITQGSAEITTRRAPDIWRDPSPSCNSIGLFRTIGARDGPTCKPGRYTVPPRLRHSDQKRDSSHIKWAHCDANDTYPAARVALSALQLLSSNAMNNDTYSLSIAPFGVIPDENISQLSMMEYVNWGLTERGIFMENATPYLPTEDLNGLFAGFPDYAPLFGHTSPTLSFLGAPSATTYVLGLCSYNTIHSHPVELSPDLAYGPLSPLSSNDVLNMRPPVRDNSREVAMRSWRPEDNQQRHCYEFYHSYGYGMATSYSDGIIEIKDRALLLATALFHPFKLTLAWYLTVATTGLLEPYVMPSTFILVDPSKSTSVVKPTSSVGPHRNTGKAKHPSDSKPYSRPSESPAGDSTTPARRDAPLATIKYDAPRIMQFRRSDGPWEFDTDGTCPGCGNIIHPHDRKRHFNDHWQVDDRENPDREDALDVVCHGVSVEQARRDGIDFDWADVRSWRGLLWVGGCFRGFGRKTSRDRHLASGVCTRHPWDSEISAPTGEGKRSAPPTPAKKGKAGK